MVNFEINSTFIDLIDFEIMFISYVHKNRNCNKEEVHSTMALNAVLVKGIMWYCNSVFPA
jgi:hypothetical protein